MQAQSADRPDCRPHCECSRHELLAERSHFAAEPRRPVPDRRQPALPQPGSRSAGAWSARATPSPIQSPVSGARSLLMPPARCPAGDRRPSCRRVNHQPGAACQLDHARTLYRLTGDIKNAPAVAEHVATLTQFAARGRAGRQPVLGRRAVRGREHPSCVSARAGDHVEALRLLARIEHQRGVLDDAEARLEAVLTASPGLPRRASGLRPCPDRPAEILRAREEIEGLLDARTRQPGLPFAVRGRLRRPR